MVAILARKPWVFARRRLFGWKVRFDIDEYSPAKRKELDYLCAYLLSRNEPQIKLLTEYKPDLSDTVCLRSGMSSTTEFVCQLPAGKGVKKSLERPRFLGPKNKTRSLWIPFALGFLAMLVSARFTAPYAVNN